MTVSPCRSFLFAPADSERKAEKAFASEADAVVLDLEDAVAEAGKARARVLARERLAMPRGPDQPQRWVRINPFDSRHRDGDLDAVVCRELDGIILPKAEGIEQLRAFDRLVGQLEQERGIAGGTIQLFLIAGETPRGVLRCLDYPVGSPRLAAMSWGPWDLAAALGASSNRLPDGSLKPTYELARSFCLLGAAAAEVAAIETAPMDFRDTEAISRFARRAASDGFTGVIAIHPAQIGPIHEAMTPSAEEVEHARRVKALFASDAGVGAVGLDGQMLDRPHLLQAERVLARAELARSPR